MSYITDITAREILDKGAAFYKNYGMGRSRGTLPFQLAGNIRQGGLVEKAFGAKPVDGKAWLPKVMSRKKDVVPKFEKVFA